MKRSCYFEKALRCNAFSILLIFVSKMKTTESDKEKPEKVG